jgi:transposase
MPRPRRTFSAELKAQVVVDLLTGAATQAELSRKHNIKPQLLAFWKSAVLDRLPSLFGAEEAASRDEARVAELEQLVGQQALELAILKKASRLLTGPPHKNGRSS